MGFLIFFFFQAEDGIRDKLVTGVQTCALPIYESVFSLTQLPRRLAVIGAGPIGCELAQAFARFGSQVTVLERMDRILPREDTDAADLVKQAMVRDGVRFVFRAQVLQVLQHGAEKVLYHKVNGVIENLVVDEILVGVGRAPNVEGLSLEVAGVLCDHDGIIVNDQLQTSNPRVFAAGDVCSKYKFTHAADAMARIVIANALFRGWQKASALVIPWCTYADPELAHVGLYEKEARGKGLNVQTFMWKLDEVDRAVLDGEESGLARVLVRRGSDKILGATIGAAHAGDVISEITLAMTNRLGLGDVVRTIHPYPTQAEVVKKLGDAYNRTRLTPFVKKILEKGLSRTRRRGMRWETKDR